MIEAREAIHLVLEYAAGGSLQQLVTARGQLSEPEVPNDPFPSPPPPSAPLSPAGPYPDPPKPGAAAPMATARRSRTVMRSTCARSR